MVKILVEILLLEVSLVLIEVLLVVAKRRHLVDRPLVFPDVGNEFSHLQIPKRTIQGILRILFISSQRAAKYAADIGSSGTVVMG